MPLEAVIFDLDGTLTATHFMHARAFAEAFEAYGYGVGVDRIVRKIGEGGDRLVPEVLGEEAEAQHGDALRDRHGDRYLELVEQEGAPLRPGAVELIETLHARGIRTAIATGSKEEAMEHVMRYAETDLTELVDVVVSDADVENTKPAVDAVAAALDKLGVAPTQAVMVGDTPFDVETAARAGVACFGVTADVYSAEELHRAGARAVYADPAALLDDLDAALELAVPGDAALTPAVMERLMRAALAEARAGMEAGEVPIGAVAARFDGTVLGRGHNRAHDRGTPVAHAELEALQEAGAAVRADVHDLVLVTTLEPCIMCHGAAMNARVDTIVYALPSPANGGPRRCAPYDLPRAVPPRVVGGVQRQPSHDLLVEWLERHPDDGFVRDLIGRVG